MANAAPGAGESRQAVITGMSATSAFGRGTAPLLAGALSGQPAFCPVRRFSVDGRRATAAAELEGPAVLTDELVAVIGDGYHVCQPSPDGRGLARAIGAALVILADQGLPGGDGETPAGDSGAALLIGPAWWPREEGRQ